MLTNATALLHAQAYASVANREFPVFIQVQGCGETGLYTLQGASYTATLWFTLVQGAMSHTLLSSFARAYKDSNAYLFAIA